MTVVGLWASGIVEARLGTKDPQIVCIDEVAGVFVTWLAAPPTWKGLIVGVVLFRIFDQWKPWPARAAERLGGGAGVMLDDVVAGVWGAALLAAPGLSTGSEVVTSGAGSVASVGGAGSVGRKRRSTAGKTMTAVVRQVSSPSTASRPNRNRPTFFADEQRP